MSASSNRTGRSRTCSAQELLESGELDAIIVAFGDVHGRWRGKTIPAERFRKDPSAPVQFSDYVFALDRAEDLIEPDTDLPWWPLGEGGFRDLLLHPEIETLRLVPWRTRTALVLGRLQTRDGVPFLASPRDILAGLGDRATSRGLEPVVAAELEFVLYRQTEDEIRSAGHTTPQALHAESRPYDVERFEIDEDLLLPVLDGLQEMGFGIDCWSVEAGVSQYEFNWGHGALIDSADQAFLFKPALRQLARRHGLTATFMAKPETADMGSSMHVHQSLWDASGTNVFHDPGSSTGLSQRAMSYLAGQLDAMRELTGLFAPTVNSYKRFVPGTSAGINATWGVENPMAGVRAILDGPAGTRLEFRLPGADANPYLALATSLAAGLSGLDRGLQPGPSSDGDASTKTDVPAVAGTLGEAAGLLLDSAVAREYLGTTFVDYYATVCRWEANLAARAVTDWERKRYLLGS